MVVVETTEYVYQKRLVKRCKVIAELVYWGLALQNSDALPKKTSVHSVNYHRRSRPQHQTIADLKAKSLVEGSVGI